MLTIFDSLRSLTTVSVIFRMVLAYIIGAIVGLERTYRNKPAGFRTHILVCLGASIAALTGQYIYLVAKLPADMSRIPAGVVTGLGFIGAGTIIITNRQRVKGLTTAAGMWATGLIGLAAGSGFYEGAVLGLILILTIEILFNRIRSNIRYSPEFRVAVSYYHKEDLDMVLRFCKDNPLSLCNLKITGSNNGAVPVYSALITMKATGRLDTRKLVETVNQMDGIISAEEI